MSHNALYNSNWGFVKDPIYGYIRLSETEKNIIDTRPVQRLRRIRQLAGAEYVYPAANHTRFEHVIGSMYLAGIVADNLPVKLSSYEQEKIRLAALLHDVGHAPFSHLFDPILARYLHRNHEEMSSWIIAKSSLADVIRNQGFDPEELSHLAVGKSEANPAFFNQIISSAFDVDKMDFVVRDSYHTGAGYGSVDVFRLAYTMDVLNNNLAVDVTALPTLESLILARLESFRTIYFHRACRAVHIMLLRALNLAKDDLEILKISTPEQYLEWDDYNVWSQLAKNPKSRPIMLELAERRLLKCAYERTAFVKEEPESSVFTDEGVRSKLEAKIASMANIAVEDIAIDVPSLPSVPYYYAMDVKLTNIPLFYKTKTGEKIPQNITKRSRILDALQVFMNTIRVYTKHSYREKVRNVANQVLGEATLSGEI